jgi:hypothetical protein
MLEAPHTIAANHFRFAQLLHEAMSRPGLISEAYRAFHRYSLGNQILAAMQLLERGLPLSPIASFNTWKERRRQVKKGEKALSLWMPIATRREDEVTGEVTLQTRFLLRRNWFSLEQTEGEPYAPELQSPDWDGAKALAALEIREVLFSALDGNIQGHASGRAIAINPMASLRHKTRFHEVAHILLGHTATGDVSDAARLPRALAEAEAEGTAYLLCAILGLPGLEEARGYIQHWLAREPIPDASSRRIFVTADTILKAGAPPLAGVREASISRPHQVH